MAMTTEEYNKTHKELICPECNGDMKEYVTRFICRHCKYEYKKIFQILKKE
jgi:hypothetical protein